MNLSDPIHSYARSQGSVPAIIQGDRTISYEEFDAMVNAISVRLADQGAVADFPVGVCLLDRPLHLAAIFAVLRLGAILLPMDWRWTVAEQGKIARKFQPRVMLIEPSRPRPSDVKVVPVESSWENPSDSVAPQCTYSFAHRRAIFGLSSGTTGEPKAYVTTHAQYRERIDSFANACGLRNDDRYCSALPLAFSAGRLFALANLVAGATVVLLPSLSSPIETAAQIVGTKCTTTCLVPSVSRAMLGLQNNSEVAFPDLRVLMSIGAPLHSADRTAIRQRLSSHLIDIYACTGGSLASVIGPAEQERFPDSVGRPAKGVGLQIVDEQDHPLPAGTVGRVRYRGPGMPLGSFPETENPDDDLRDGWCYPGDFASINDEGYIFLQGRRSEIVIRGGINVFTPEIERALLAHALILEAAVIGVPSNDAGEELVAFIRCHAQLQDHELLAHCRGLLAAYKIPSRFHRVDSVPKNTGGKVLKNSLAQIDADSRAKLAD